MRKWARARRFLWLLCGACLLTAACSSNEVDHDLPDDEDFERLGLEDGRANVSLELAVAQLPNGAFELGTTLETQSDLTFDPVVVFVFDGAIEIVAPLPDSCVREGDSIRCELAGPLSFGEPTPLSVTVGLPAGSRDVNVSATVTSRNNPLTNDPVPTNNVGTATLSEGDLPADDE